MREFMAQFNKIVNKISATKRPTMENQKYFFVNSMPSNVSFHLRREKVVDLDATKTLEIELEDDFTTVEKWRELQKNNAQTLTFTDPMI